jgi:hypothetical protein
MAVNAFTGEDDGVNPLQSIVGGARNVGQGIQNSMLSDPQSRSALLQIGLGLMQPMAMGQSVAGHIGQGIGGGGEAVTRLDVEEQAKKKQEDAMDIAQGKLDVEKQNAASYAKGVGLKGLIDRQALELERQRGREALLGTKNYAAHAKNIFETIASPAFDPKSPDNAPFARFKGKDPSEIEDILRSEGSTRKGTAAATTPQSQDDEARAWALANPTDPRAAQIRKRLGM